MKFQQIRGATSIITFARKRFLLDPFLAPKGSCPPVPSPCNELPNPLVELPLPIKEIVDVDAVIVTHMHHFDHFDAAAANAIPKDMPIFVQSDRENTDMRNLGFNNVITLKENGVKFGDITLYRTEALHGSGVTADYYYKMHNVPADACGVVLSAPGEKVFYAAGDTLWFAGVQKALEKFQPDIIALNVANAQFQDGTPILMGLDGLKEVMKTSPNAKIIATHLDAVNHAHLGRKEIAEFAAKNGLQTKLSIPDDGETIIFES